METRMEQRKRLSERYARLSEENQAKVRRNFEGSCQGLMGNAVYFPSVGRNAGALAVLIHRLSLEEGLS